MWTWVFLELMLGMLFSVISLVGLVHVYADENRWAIYATYVLPIVVIVFGADCHFRLGRLADTMPFEDAVALDRDPQYAEVWSSFSENYYKDPILNESIEELLEDSDYFDEETP